MATITGVTDGNVNANLVNTTFAQWPYRTVRGRSGVATTRTPDRVSELTLDTRPLSWIKRVMLYELFGMHPMLLMMETGKIRTATGTSLIQKWMVKARTVIALRVGELASSPGAQIGGKCKRGQIVAIPISSKNPGEDSVNGRIDSDNQFWGRPNNVRPLDLLLHLSGTKKDKFQVASLERMQVATDEMRAAMLNSTGATSKPDGASGSGTWEETDSQVIVIRGYAGSGELISTGDANLPAIKEDDVLFKYTNAQPEISVRQTGRQEFPYPLFNFCQVVRSTTEMGALRSKERTGGVPGLGWGDQKRELMIKHSNDVEGAIMMGRSVPFQDYAKDVQETGHISSSSPAYTPIRMYAQGQSGGASENVVACDGLLDMIPNRYSFHQLKKGGSYNTGTSGAAVTYTDATAQASDALTFANPDIFQIIQVFDEAFKAGNAGQSSGVRYALIGGAALNAVEYAVFNNKNSRINYQQMVTSLGIRVNMLQTQRGVVHLLFHPVFTNLSDKNLSRMAVIFNPRTLVRVDFDDLFARQYEDSPFGGQRDRAADKMTYEMLSVFTTMLEDGGLSSLIVTNMVRDARTDKFNQTVLEAGLPATYS